MRLWSGKKSRHVESSESSEEYLKCESSFKREIRRAKKGNEMDLASKVKKNLKIFCRYFKMDDKGRLEWLSRDEAKGEG